MASQKYINTVERAVLSGFVDAHKTYESWSFGSWLWEAPEYLICTSIAQKIYEIGNIHITLEHGTKSTLEEAGAKGRGRLPRHMRPQGRVDLLLWEKYADETILPKAVVEVKNQNLTTDAYIKDIVRLASMLNRNVQASSIDFGVFAFYYSAHGGSIKTAKEKVLDKIENVFNNSEDAVAPYNIKIRKKSKLHFAQSDSWAATCITLERE